MPDQGQWDDERHKVAAKIKNVPYQLFALGMGKLFGKIAHYVMQHITMLFHRGMNGESLHEKMAVFLIRVGEGQALNLGDDSPQLCVMPLAVGEGEEIYGGCENQLKTRSTYARVPVVASDDKQKRVRRNAPVETGRSTGLPLPPGATAALS
jgi:hypothetical protein